MTSSIKKNRVDNSKSNKKALITSNSNKSLKVLRENSHLTTSTTAKKKDKQNRDTKQDEKKGTILVKNIKNKIVGNTATNPLTVKNSNNNRDNIKKNDSKVDYRAIPTDHDVTTPRNKNINKSMNITIKNVR